MTSTGQAPVRDRTAAVPLWQQLLTDVRSRLVDGALTGDFRGELALVEHFGVSRHTVREALRHLRAEGVVTAELEQARGLEQRSLVRALDIRADGVVASRPGLEEPTPLVYLERLHLAGPEPLATAGVSPPPVRGDRHAVTAESNTCGDDLTMSPPATNATTRPRSTP